jgi:hypothetical protein
MEKDTRNNDGENQRRNPTRDVFQMGDGTSMKLATQFARCHVRQLVAVEVDGQPDILPRLQDST